jgi:hypothetical protein
MNIIKSRKFTKSGDNAYGCVGGVDMKKQQVGVIGGIRKITLTKSRGKLYIDYVVRDKLAVIKLSICSYSESQLDQCSISCLAVVAG